MEMRIMQRTAQDGYHAQLIAQGMENAGADVFAITSDLRGVIQVYCKHRAEVGADRIDQEIDEEVAAKAIFYAAQ
jgi:hypothetical protein